MEFVTEFVERFRLIETVVTAFLAFLGYAGKKAYPFVKDALKTIKKESNSDIISWLAEEAVELMESRFEGQAGADKFEEATAWLAEPYMPFDEEALLCALQRKQR
ncbi:hypothetical protein HUG20_01250 [Salicibibacter cibi]|uniref:Uncharacterized protein n=1 Tax=Salicibibacter cibi TaxID=2743001 RepID=A0A7T7CE55_9BACI|nr:phage holin, LLH family [Salicibibacter cibi]QQK78665.1 hypothetical protein HUG20_01250 [Salicibibacter cibi]